MGIIVRKTVIFIVEGQTDKDSLQNIFKKIYRDKNIHFEVIHGDITSDWNIKDDSELEKRIINIVSSYINDNKLKKNDIWQICHIFDMDGAYIPDSAILSGDTEYFLYSENSISCKDREKVIERNQRKSHRISYLRGLRDIYGISYKCYYLSSNLEHVLWDKINLTDEEKMAWRDKAVEVFENNSNAFINHLNNIAKDVPRGFIDSWKYIEIDLHSLERHTNLNLYFKDNPIL